MATISFGFTINGGNGVQTVELIKVSDSSVISSITANAANGSPFAANWQDDSLDCDDLGNVRIRITSGAVSAESSNFNMDCPCKCTTWSIQTGASGGDLQYQNCQDAPIFVGGLGANQSLTFCINNNTTPNLMGTLTGNSTGSACT